MEIQGDRMLSFAGKEREMYQGLSDAEKDVIIAADELNTAVEAVESEADDLELDLLQAQDATHTAKVNTIRNNLVAKYGSRDLNLHELMYELNYNQHKAKDFLQVIGRATASNVAVMVVRDSNDETLRDENFNRLVKYLTERYKSYIGCPIENLELETGIDHKISLPIAKKMMGLHPKSVVKFIPVDVIAKIIFEDI